MVVTHEIFRTTTRKMSRRFLKDGFIFENPFKTGHKYKTFIAKYSGIKFYSLEAAKYRIFSSILRSNDQNDYLGIFRIDLIFKGSYYFLTCHCCIKCWLIRETLKSLPDRLTVFRVSAHVLDTTLYLR